MNLTRLLVPWVLALPAYAADRPDLALNDGIVLRKARITAIGDTHAHILHEGGLEMFEIDRVPLDALARARIEKDEKDADPNRRASEDLARVRALDADERQRTQEERDRLAKARRALDAEARTAFVKVFQVVPGVGFLVSGNDAYTYVERTEQVTRQVQDTGLNAHKKKTVRLPHTSVHKMPAGLGDMFLVASSTEGITDGQLMFVKLWRIGEHRYTSVQGAGRTVPRYTRDPVEYLDFLAPPEVTAQRATTSEPKKVRVKF